MEILLFRIVLAVLLFFLINWVGSQSYSKGYIQLSMVLKSDEAPLFNFMLRFLSPIVYIIIVSTILYVLKLDKYTKNIYWVNVVYLSFRLLFNLVRGRGLLLNWSKEILYWVTVIPASIFIYKDVIKIKQNLLPNFQTISNELWLIIFFFLYEMFNRTSLPSAQTEKRKKRYICNRYKKYNKKFGDLVDKKAENSQLKSLIYAIIIYEDFNRPKIVRIIENILFFFGLSKTLGIMQVKTAQSISDEDSVKEGVDKIIKDYQEVLTKNRGGAIPLLSLEVGR